MSVALPASEKTLEWRGIETLLFGSIAIVSLALAAVLSPAAIIPSIPPQAVELKAQLIMGIGLARLVLLAAAGFAVFCEWFHLKYRLFPSDIRKETGIFSWNRQDLAIAGVLLALAFVVRLPGLNGSLMGDEVTSLVRLVRRGLPTIFGWSVDANNHFMNSILMYINRKLFGEGSWSMRLPAFLLGAAGPPVAYLFGVKFLPRPAMIVTACVMTLQLHYVDFSNQARGYAGAILFGALSCYLFLGLCEGPSRKVALGYVTVTSLAAGFLLPTLLFPVVHLIVGAAWGVNEVRLQKTRATVFRWSGILITCLWGIIFGLLINALTIPQVLDYSRNRADGAHIAMGVTLAVGILQYVSGVYHLTVAIVLVLAATLGWFAFREKRYLVGAVLAPPAAFLATFTMLGLLGSPRVFLLLAFPVVLGIGLFAYSEWVTGSIARRVIAIAVLGAFLADGGPELFTYYRVGNPALREAAQRLPAAQLLFVGDHAGENAAYYSPRSRWRPWTRDESAILAEVKAVDPPPEYIIFGTGHCPDGELKGVGELGYRVLARLPSWRNTYPVIKEPATCYVVYRR